MSLSLRTAAIALALAAIAGSIATLFVTGKDSPRGSRQEQSAKVPAVGQRMTNAIAGAAEDGQTKANISDDMLAAVMTRLRAATTTERSAMLQSIGDVLDTMESTEAEELMLGELQSGRDADTGLSFVPGEEGLASASSWRVFLLDRLGRLNPKLAAEFARQSIFPFSNSAEEWAISLRNVLRSYPPTAMVKSQTEISTLLGQMMARPEWRAARSQGLLEALDFAAYTDNPAAHFAAASRWSGDDERAASAAQIAVERTMVQRGDELLPALAASAGTTPDNTLRASAMARADLRRPAQAQAVADFLRGQAPGSAGATVFFNAFPLHRFSVAPGLAGIPRVRTAAEMRAADEAAAKMIELWSKDPSLAAHRESLEELEGKLLELTGQK
jgi:hypothetical protein